MNRRVVNAIAVSILCAAVFTTVAQSQATALVAWDEELSLTWSHFNGAVPSNASQMTEAAAIKMEIKWYAGHQYTFQGNSAQRWLGTPTHLVVSNVMNPQLSWVYHPGATASLLRHEQGHFDLNEAYSRKLTHLLSCALVQARTAEQARTLLDDRLHALAKSVDEQVKLIHEIYDRETVNGTDLSAQARWESDTALWLTQPLSAPDRRPLAAILKSACVL